MGEKKKTLIIRSLIRSIGFIIEFIKKLSRLVILMSFIVCRDSLGLKNPFNGVVDELWGGGCVLTQKWCYLDLLWVVPPFFEHSYLLYDLEPFYYQRLDVGS